MTTELAGWGSQQNGSEPKHLVNRVKAILKIVSILDSESLENHEGWSKDSMNFIDPVHQAQKALLTSKPAVKFRFSCSREAKESNRNHHCWIRLSSLPLTQRTRFRFSLINFLVWFFFLWKNKHSGNSDYNYPKVPSGHLNQ